MRANSLPLTFYFSMKFRCTHPTARISTKKKPSFWISPMGCWTVRYRTERQRHLDIVGNPGKHTAAAGCDPPWTITLAHSTIVDQ